MSNQIETYIEIKLENRDQVSVLFRYVLIVPILIFAAAFAASQPACPAPTTITS